MAQRRAERMRAREKEKMRVTSPLASCAGTIKNKTRNSITHDPLRPSAPAPSPSPSPHATLRATCPSTLSISAKSAAIRDDFPQPTWPTTATREPSGMEKVMLKRHDTPCLSRGCHEPPGSGLPPATSAAEHRSGSSLRVSPRVRHGTGAGMSMHLKNGGRGSDLSHQQNGGVLTLPGGCNAGALGERPPRNELWEKGEHVPTRKPGNSFQKGPRL